MRDALNNLHIFKTVRVKVSASPGGVLGPLLLTKDVQAYLARLLITAAQIMA